MGKQNIKYSRTSNILLTKQSYSLPSRAFDNCGKKNPYILHVSTYTMCMHNAYVYMYKFIFMSSTYIKYTSFPYCMWSFCCLSTGYFREIFPRFMKANAIYIFYLRGHSHHKIYQGYDIFFFT